ncbi:L-xylo-3-hexulose reductase [Colletotrichum spinosum]|uniref:L-xylo-3-hexulose reductase n=1 Tax=Colletotrichum spinosum TaxID=1347390 RepID=A0A4R8QNS8_9PEZI|nr:L-xylo-3-hexulose reductase [Colletotrichum spinosum]
MSLPLKNKVALITGASRGLGAGMALTLASEGASVMLIYTSASSTPKVESLISEITSLPHTPLATSVRTDLSSPSAPSTILSALKSWLGESFALDILINNAGTELNAPLGTITTDDFAKVYDLNVRAPLLLTQALLPHLATRNARIINISSVGGRFGFPGLGLYCSSKAALESLTRCWARELGGNGTTVNCVAPGPVQSDMLDKIPKGIIEMQKRQTPVENRLGEVDEVAAIVAWLAGEKSSWVSGQVISASGGWAMY